MDNSIEDILDVLLRNTTTFSIEEIKNNLDTILHGILNAIENNDFQHVWDIKIHDEREKLICVSRLTVAILKKNS